MKKVELRNVGVFMREQGLARKQPEPLVRPCGGGRVRVQKQAVNPRGCVGW
jgi:hypothetical protein